MKIYVTGMGVISSIGNNVDENLDALIKGSCGISQIEGLDNLRKPFLGGEVKYSNNELRNKLNISHNDYIQRSSLLGLIAAREAWGNRKNDTLIRSGIIYGNNNGGINFEEDLLFSDKFSLDDKEAYLNLHSKFFATDFIANQMDLKGYKATISTACSTVANAILLGARLIKANLLDRVLVGGGEAITHSILNGFDSLMLYDTEKCKPFDETRKGINVGEAGVFLVIENEESTTKTNQEKIVELIGWGNACDAYHMTASSPEGIGAITAINEALEMANITADSIDYINAHGTGTLNNDITESIVLQSVFGKNVPPFSSTKSFTGHTLVAAGGIEAVYSILAIKHNLIFPNLRLDKPMKDFNFSPERKLISDKPIKTVLTNSFGFGGNCTELIFSE